MAKKNWGWLTEGVIGALVGGSNQQLMTAAGQGALGKLTPTDAGATFGTVMAVGGGLTRLLSRRDNWVANVASGAFVSGSTVLAEAGVYAMNKAVAAKTVVNKDYTQDATLPSSTTSDSSADSSAGVSSASDTVDAFGSAADTAY